MRSTIVLSALLAACSSTPPRDALAVLAQSEAELTEGAFATALTLLESIGEDAYVGEDLERYKLAAARAKFGNGDAWGAFGVLRRYLEDHPLTVHVNAVEKLTFEIGRTLIHGTGGFWIFWSDADNGAFVLQHFVRRFPNSEHAADAYHLMGELEFQRGHWTAAQEQYRQITMFHDRSPWLAKAVFRDAMAGFHALAGPQYDLQGLERTRRELQSFVTNEKENLTFTNEAAAALATTEQWLARKHVEIADFYATVDNAAGHRYHLERAIEFGNTTAGEEARARLALMFEPDAEPSGPRR